MEPTQPEVEVLLDLKLSDLLRANLWFRYSKWSTKLSLVLMVVLTLVFAGVMLIQPRLLFVLIPLGLWLLEGFILLVIVVETKRNFSTAKDFQKQGRYHLKKEGYTASFGKSSASVSWESVLKAIESKHSFNLFLGRTLFVALPKRFFKTTADVETTRQILRTALGEEAQLR